MKDNIAKMGSACKTEHLLQRSENITDANDASQPTQNTKDLSQALTPSESFWYERLAALQPFQLPFETAGNQAEPRWIISAWQSPLPKKGEEDPLQVLLQAFVIYLARLTQQTEFQIGWCVNELNETPADLAPVVPMAVEVAFDKPWRMVADWVDDELARLAQHRTFSHDLLIRLPSLQAIPALTTHRPWQIAVSVIQDDQTAPGELLTLQVNAQGGFRWVYDENRLSTEGVLRMSEHLQVLASSKRQGEEIPVGQLNVLPEAERTLLLETWNATENPYPNPLCIHQLFEQQVERAPETPALEYQEQTLSYAELNSRANRLAHQLIAQGVTPDQQVAICVERSPAMVVALLAVLKAGGAYVPLDSTYPGERLAYILNDTAPSVVLADAVGRAVLGEEALAGLTVLDPNTLPDQPDSNPQVAALTPQHLVYVIYTSGSTGQPKGVMVEHQSVYQRYLGFNETYAVTAQDRVLQFSSFAFDASVEEFYSSLCHGATLVIRDDSWLASVQEFITLIRQNRITVMSLPTLFWSEVAARDKALPLPDCLRLIIIGGEAVQKRAIQAWFAQETYRPRLLNTYGPTENTVIATCKEILSPADDRSIGRPVKNTCIYLLDKNGQPVPLGCIGEMYIGGVGVARGYLNQPELSAERFIRDPFSPVSGAQMYRTGDLARYLADGELAFLGRNDQQVKIRGFRVELGEIEARLLEYPAVQEAAVLALDGRRGKRLVAYVAAQVHEGLAADLRAHLSTILPDYMIPAAFVRLESFPQTPNGKLDRRALPAPGEEDFARQIYEAPQGEAEIAIAALWRELLGIEQISRHDSFFALGGHSLLGVQMIERLRHQGVTLAARDLFQSPVLSDLAQMLGRHQAVIVPPNVMTPATTALTPEMLPLIDLTQPDIDHIVGLVPGGMANIQDIYALSSLQDGILFHHVLEKEGDPYLVLYPVAFANRALLDRYLAAVQQAIDRHDILRTVFIWEGLSVPAQVVWRQATLSVTELILDPADGSVIDQLTRRFDPGHYRLNLNQAPLLHFVIAQETDGRWFLLELQHHLIGDHETMEVMHREVQACFSGQEDRLPVPVPFRNLVAEVRLGVSQAAHTRFFTDMLAEVDEPTLPFGLTEVHRDGSRVTESYRMLTAGLNDRLRSQARRLGVSLAALCHLAWAQVLSCTSGQEKVVFGTVLFGRMAAGNGADNGMGLFINTLPLRLDIDDTPVRDSVQEVHLRLAGLLAHEHASLALAQRCSGVASGTPLFSALLNYRHNEQPDPLDETMAGIEFLGEQERTNYPFGLSVEDGGSSLGLTAYVVQPFDPDRICGYMQQALESLAEALEQAPETPVRVLNILPATERTLLLETWNATETPYPDPLCIHQLFEQQVEITPNATALMYQQQTLSYAELNACANRLAHQLIALGVTPDQRVVIGVARSPAMVVALLAVLKAGGAYVPLDPAYPRERLVYILNDTAPSVVLVDAAGRAALGEEALGGLTVLDPNTVLNQPDSNPRLSGLTPQHLAYVIYTSGSTGQPKGVMVEHQAVYQRHLGLNETYAITAQDRVLQFASFAFDVLVEECFSSLCRGATLVMRDDSWLASMREFIDLSRQYRITVMFLPASFWSELMTGDNTLSLPDELRLMVFGGQSVKKSAIQAWFTQETHRPRLLNAYGPTENTVTATCKEILSPEDVRSIGRPLKNTCVYLLDRDGQLVPLGGIGEMYIGGVGVARGYLNRPALSVERFIPDPFSPVAGARMYRTGDLARYLPDGDLEFLGRNDHQVKIRGFRVELGEIETRLMEHPAVQEAVVLALDDGRNRRLVAYVAAEANGGLVACLREHLSVLLPDYMVPAAFVRLDALPLMPNGKLDHRALPAPGEEDVARQIYEAPQGEAEIALAAIWRELLGIEQVSRHDNFFALGGHSLLAVRMIERLRHLRLTLTARDLFQSPVLSELAQTLGWHCAVMVPPNVITLATTALTPAMLPLIDLTQPEIDHIIRQVLGGAANIQDIYALSPLQDGILFHHLLANEGDPYLLAGQMAFADRSLLDRYLAAVQQVVERHDILRTAFIWQGLSVPVQVVWRQVPLSVTELTLDPVDGPVGDQLAERFNPRHYRLDLGQAPLLRFVIAQETDGRWFLLELQHHLLGDYTTMKVMHREVQAYLAEREDSLSSPVPFRNLVAQARLGVSQAEHTRFFTDMLAEVDEPTLPFGLAEVHLDGSQEMEAYRMLMAGMSDRLRHQARRLGVSLAALCHLAWAQVLSCTSGQEKVVFGTVLFGRMAAGEGADSGMGLFINTLPLRLDMDETPVRDSVRAVHLRLAGLLEHEHASLALAQRCSGVASGTPLFSALLNYRHNDQPDLLDETMDGIEFLGEQERTNYPFGLSVEDDGTTLGLIAHVVQPFEPDRICGYMQQALESLVEALEQAPETPVRALNILPEAERTLLLKTWNVTESPYPDPLCIHQLFEQQAEQTPQATALEYQHQFLSYAELNACANRLAHQLMTLGVTPDQPVAICVARSPVMVVALLAVLKAGGAYVPLDPTYPEERLAYILNDTAPSVVLADAAGRAALGEEILAGLTVLDPNILPDQPDSNPQVPALTPQHLAYVIYTSGSTGQPKGVMVEHQAVYQRYLGFNETYAVTAQDRVLQFAAFAFDVSIEECFSSLCNGATLVMRDDSWLASMPEFIALAGQSRITVMSLPALFWSELVVRDDGLSLPDCLRFIIIGGEAVKKSAIQDWFGQETHRPRLLNAYGPTENTVTATCKEILSLADDSSIGWPIKNTCVYLLNRDGQPVPLGCVGEMYIGGVGVARGYLNRPELSAACFMPDPFSPVSGARMYRTGDLARYLPDGDLEFLGRNDQQVKIRGFRVELGEIEARLMEHPVVQEAAVLALDDGQNKRLVAYVVAEANEGLVVSLREHLRAVLPDYMVPVAFVRLDTFPQTPNRKLDLRALPALGEVAFARQVYEAPQGKIETMLAVVWSELLGVEQIGRHDSFFALGGHSLLAVSMIERLRRIGLGVSVQALFQCPTLCILAQSLVQYDEILVPDNPITPDTVALTPDLLPLIDLTQPEIDLIVGQVPGGMVNIQDIYALSPLQDGILFHHLLESEGDPYLLISQMAFADRTLLDNYLTVVQRIIDRHDILRTAFIWQGLSVPAQVVWRQAQLSVTELTLDPADGPISDQLIGRFNPRHYRLDLGRAPLLHFVIAQEGAGGRWILFEYQHHLIGDHTTLEVMNREVQAYLTGQEDSLPEPTPFRNLVAQARLGVSQAEHISFFTEMLAEVDEPTLSFGLTEVHRDGSQVMESHRMLTTELNDRLRSQARHLGVSLAALCHLAWAQVLSRTSGQEKVVFGTVLFGRMQAGDGADSGMGLFINTLPLRLDMDETSVRDSVQAAHSRLAGLLAHEHTSLALAQRCSSVRGEIPLFNSLFNYRHNVLPATTDELISGIEFIDGQERTNYPLALSVEDFGESLGLTAQVVQPIDPERICGYMQQALESLIEALEQAPETPVRTLNILPETEHTLLLKTWNATETAYPNQWCIHQLFEQQVEKTPDATALVYEEQTLCYAELNARANRLAHQLIALGVVPDQRVAICASRSLAMVVGLLAVLKAGGAYVPLDPAYPGERLVHILNDVAPSVILADEVGCAVLGREALAGLTVLDPNLLPDQSDRNPQIPALTSRHLAYVIYTSGSTGTPKGVMVEHRSLLNLHGTLTERAFVFSPAPYRVSLNASISFDAALQNILGLLNGYTLVIVPQDVRADSAALLQFLARTNLDVLDCTPMQLEMLLAAGLHQHQKALTLLIGGEPISVQTWQAVASIPQLTAYNVYGPTECTVDATLACIAPAHPYPTIGRPLANTRLYLLDKFGCPVPLGVVGELYIGGAGVARGYLNRPELTAECFLVNSFNDKPGARMYKTGDLARYLPDGNLEFLGRNDHQVKIRGFRIELGEIETRLLEHPAVSESAVLALGEGQDKCLVAYVVAQADDGLVNRLRSHLSTILPDYMVPSAFVCLDVFPLTPNGKLDRRALPAPGEEAFARQVYEAPQGKIETMLAAVWCELLGVEQISRHDSFFALGGHSLLVVRMIERLRRIGLGVSVQTLFLHPTLHVLAQSLVLHDEIPVPDNRITPDTVALTPDLLPLIDLTQPEIDLIVGQVPGGMGNIQDIYGLSPLQDGILFHHLLENDGDPYLLISQMAFADRALLDHYLAAVQRTIDRHDILRTAFIWKGLSVPAQVVWRQAQLSVTELILNSADGPISDQLTGRFDLCRHRIDLSQAPLLHFVIAQEGAEGRWILLEYQHHLIGDHTTLEVMDREVQAYLAGQEACLPAPVPFRNLVAQARLGVSQEEHTRFFTEMLAEVDEPTLSFGLKEVRRDGSQVTESHRMLTSTLNDRLRNQARCLGVSLAALCHLAWAQVLACTCGQEKVVFGTVLFGRMQAGDGADSGMGLFINTLPLRLDMDDTPVRDGVQAAHSRLAGLLVHEHASLALAQRCSGVRGEIPLFNSLLNYRHNTQLETSDELISGIEFIGGQERTNYPLALSVEDFGESLGLTAQVVQPLDPERICGYMQQALESLAEALEQSPETPVRALNILPETERTLLLRTWNAFETAYPEQLCIHQLFEQQAKENPDTMGLVYEDQTFSYAELNARANRLAHQLIRLGVVPDQRVVICVARSPAMVVGLLAVLKAGGAYVPLDPAYPGERLAHILKDVAPAILLADNVGRTALGEKALTERAVLDPNILFDQPDSNPQVPALTSRYLAYVIYTSGSTGTPKGVMVEHRSVVNLALAQITRFDVRVTSRILQFASLGFDASVAEIMTALGGGAGLIIPADTVRQDPNRLWHYLEAQKVTHAFLTPALLQEGGDLPALTIKPTLILGGETPGTALLQVLCGRVNLFNDYGPTEVTVCATTWHCPPDYTDTGVPIGHPTANTRVYLLDAHGHPVPLGAVGELYIGGAGVARGYFNRPDLTTERFLMDPFSDKPGARMYRTGDLARYLPDGNLVFVGRNDQQVKIRGFRIEPGEIEAHLTEHPAVREAWVLALRDGQDKRLVAYVVAPEDDGLINSLRAHLSAALPDYMVPTAFVRLDAFPLTLNGKLDRRVLPAPGEEAFARQHYEAPQGEAEIALAAIWRELLGIEQISRYDNFFALGGHSLLAVRMMNRIAALGIELPLSALFEAPALIAFAEAMRARFDEQRRILPVIMPISREEVLPLSFAQQRLWFLAQFEGVSDTYHIPMVLRLCGRLDIVAWQQALDTLFARHEALRSVFVSVDGQPQVQLLAADSGLPLSQHDLRGIPDAETVLERLSTEETYTPFDLGHGPLIRASLIRLTDDEYHFLLTQHHIVSDGWSVGVLMHELSTLYTAFLAGQPDSLPPLAIQYPDYSAWQRQWLSAERVQAQSDYWRTMLVGAPVLLDLPTDRPRPPQQSFTGNIVPVDLDAELTQSLKRLSEQQGVTLFMTLLSAWATVLSHLSGQEDLVIGTPSAGRSRQEVESLIGFFINTLALRIDLSGAPNVIELLARVRQTALAAQMHQDLPFEQVVEIVQPPRRLAHTPLFQVMFAWQNNESLEWGLPELVVSPVDPVLDIVKFDLELELSEEEGRIVGMLSYATALFDQPTIERYVGYLHTVLQAMVVHPQQPVREIDILAPAERRLLLETWNATETAYPDQLCIHQLFEQQAGKMPDMTALVYQDQTFSYAELNTRANRLAHQLIALGVEPDQRVAICIARSPAMVVGLLAVLKAGGAYVPLDPAYPGERLTHILIDAAPIILLADNAGCGALGEKVLASLTVLDPNSLPDQPDSNPQLPALTARHLAYVIYTSGSTGTPKGVMVEHHSVVNLALAQITRFDVNVTSRVLQFASFGFDASVSEMMTALGGGAGLIIPADPVRQDPLRLWYYLEEQRVTHAFLTPALFQERGDLPALTMKPTLVLAGEAPSTALLQALRDRVNLFNDYGPTEITVCATTWHCPSDYADTWVPIGRPTANTRVYLLDAQGQPVPLGVVGELYIGGAGVTRGYLNRPELTAERFLTDPFSDKPGARMYRTGDLARYLPDGNLVFVGRNDQQVKIRGFRIEVGEIEVRLTEHPAVSEARVLALGDGLDKYLVAYVMAQENDGLVNSLREHLSALLPDYMVPGAFVCLDAFPLTPNGKLDRQALPAPDEKAVARQVYAAPYGETEMALAAIWRELLGVEQVSRHDNFFALGGHSLLAIRMINLAAGQGLICTLNALFQCPVLSELAAKITSDLQSQSQSSAIPVRQEGTELPLFFVPSGMEDYSYVFGLAQHIRSGYPIYAVSWSSINEEAVPTMEEQAAKMISLMKAVQPAGPYRICGYSSGGILAYAIAQELLHAGETVNFLGLIDTPAPHYIREQPMQLKHQFFDELVRQFGEEHTQEMAALYRRIDELNLVQFIEVAQELALYPANLRPELVAKSWEQIECYAQIVGDYEPQVLTVTLHQFYAMERPPASPFVTDEKPKPLTIDPSLGWAQMIPDSSLRLIAVPGNHFSLLEDNENRISLAQAINRALAISCGGEVL
ncbi:non-ribosomal peptide synthetase [Photorhabdus temperata]|uniref:Amino acid adenylation enzyme/thioester reductase family protein n=1 Tax=Photorhabdus temperata subsp. temperata Meg1 TaxID=1393735 RepID=A0A081RSX5_PHOTE|nr:non-ribosomal peptide synthetase [Photorhabdus temperata]KER01778.1 amino acid adenylation enzyme/thioester reductase family protein [Photorhabdus temperata subsp. temperata Meg1]MCT8348501.1 non-ribosomal peptide synthetase [Photorhabdus temperata]